MKKPQKPQITVERVEEIIKDSKLYQGFRCNDYMIRLGLLKRLATAIVAEIKEGE